MNEKAPPADVASLAVVGIAGLMVGILVGYAAEAVISKMTAPAKLDDKQDKDATDASDKEAP